MPTEFTDSDIGKTVINANGDDVGIVADVEHGTAHVEPDPGITDTIKAKLGWGGTDEDAYPLQKETVARVTDDAVHLESDVSGTGGGATGTSRSTGMETDSERGTDRDTGMHDDDDDLIGDDDDGFTDDDELIGDDDDDDLIGDDDDGFTDDDELIGDDDDDLIGDDDDGLTDDDELIGDDDDETRTR
ncbi:hypothetical protein [Natronorubrum sulfidifaciens]|uniref:PRC-barrel domain-containing protein n=1 Tax=Natronorubrum sulfidifaciens JCM 14089 TaxID=1230460 RepID=L9W2F7_9EURY|nr:hypothetical protein [Natronorubrum sulfidifaciens]ELY43502.1 hypothetical protein C495_13991 [Natronorubrum sulfidifaciens JCM 14089]